ncbi:hypothetical protein EC991_008383 [Linnemannia zychae]|nr:hypothetical protein EC991_008383 [Linnemannia zychae]
MLFNPTHDSNRGMQQHHHKQQSSRDLSRDSFTPPPVSSSSFSSTTIVDIDAIEFDKENIQPLRQGRSAQTLARLFTTQHEDRAQQQAVIHGRFQEELAHIDNLDDPMDVYSRYVKWMIENYPQSAGQGHDSQLSPILERALADYKDDPRYRNDPRFVKLLIIYSEQITNAVDLFSFMESNGIGSEISMFYEELADFLESRDEFERAREVFKRGISRRARPLGRLRKQYDDFERRARMFEDEQSKQVNSAQPQQHYTQDPSVESSVSGGNQRRVLGVKVSGTRSVHSNAGIQGHAPIGQVRPQSPTTTPSTRGNGSSGQSRTGSKLQVYSDQDSQLPTSKPKAALKNSTPQPSTSWIDFGAEKVSSPKDAEEFTTSTSGEKNNSPPPQAPIPTKRTPTARAIIDDPQPHPTYQTKQLKPGSPRTCDVPKLPVIANAGEKSERLMIDLSDIYVDDEEFSVEEIRARTSHYTWRATNNTIHRNNNKFNEPLQSPPPLPAAGSSAKHYRDNLESGHSPERPPQKKVQPGTGRDPLVLYTDTAHAPLLSVRELLPQSPSEEERHFFGSKRRLTASPTMNTKYASEEMNKIFSDRSRTRRSMDSQWSAEDTQDIGRNELDNFTMAYSIPSIPLTLPPFPHEFLDHDVANEFEDNDDRDGQTERFITRLENGFSSTITQDIAALKRLHAEESTLGGATQPNQGNRLALLGGKWNSSRFDPFKTQESDITIAIREMAQQKHQQQQQQQQHSAEGDSSTQRVTNYGHLKSSLGRTSIGSFPSSQRRYGDVEDCHAVAQHADQEYEESPLTMFKEGTGNTDTVPMLEDEPPPAYLDKDEPI